MGNVNPYFPNGDLARPEVIKTALGERLRTVRRKLNDPSRLEFARLLGVTDKTLANHERGDSVPDASVLASYSARFGINLNWLITGEGEMFADPAKVPAKAVLVNEELMRKLAQIAIRVYDEANVGLRQDDIGLEAAVLYNELAGKADNMADIDEVEALLPWIENRLRKRLAEIKADPANVQTKRA